MSLKRVGRYQGDDYGYLEWPQLAAVACHYQEQTTISSLFDDCHVCWCYHAASSGLSGDGFYGCCGALSSTDGDVTATTQNQMIKNLNNQHYAQTAGGGFAHANPYSDDGLVLQDCACCGDALMKTRGGGYVDGVSCRVSFCPCGIQHLIDYHNHQKSVVYDAFSSYGDDDGLYDCWILSYLSYCLSYFRVHL